MLKYNGYVNNGVEAFGTEGKTVSVNEIVDTCDSKFLAHHISSHNALIPEQVAYNVLENFAVVAAELMAQGMAIQFKNGNDVVMRIYPDIHVKGGNINLARAQELIPGTTEITTENAGALIDKAGVTVRAKAECEQKFTELLLDQKASLQRVNIIEKAKVMRKDSEETEEPTSGNQGGTTPTTNGENSEP